MLPDIIISSTCTTTTRSVGELVELRSHHSQQVFWNDFSSFERWVGREEGVALHMESGKLALGRPGWGSNSCYCLEQIKPEHLFSWALESRGEKSFQELPTHGHNNNNKKKIYFSHTFSLILKASQNNSDVIHQQRHTHFRKRLWKMIFLSSRNSSPSPPRHMELNTFSAFVKLSFSSEHGFICQ